jgi:hypothetical protein
VQGSLNLPPPAQSTLPHVKLQLQPMLLPQRAHEQVRPRNTRHSSGRAVMVMVLATTVVSAMQNMVPSSMVLQNGEHIYKHNPFNITLDG